MSLSSRCKPAGVTRSTRKDKRVGVLFNAYIPVTGRSHESASEVAVENAAREAAEALAEAGFCAELIPVTDNPKTLFSALLARRHLAFVNLCEGFAGLPALEAAVVAAIELVGVPFTGNSSNAIATCQDKRRTKTLLAAAGIRVPPGKTATAASFDPGALAFPLIVKPNAEDASIGIRPNAVVKNRQQLAARIAETLRRYRQPALVERFIDGREFNVGVIETTSGPKVLPVSEISFAGLKPGEPRIVGYQAKWHATHRLYRLTVPICPARITPALKRELEAMSLKTWNVLGLRGYARIDFRTDARGRPYILEANPNPDTSLDSGLTRALTQAGIAYPDFWRDQVLQALRKPGRPSRRQRNIQQH